MGDEGRGRGSGPSLSRGAGKALTIGQAGVVRAPTGYARWARTPVASAVLYRWGLWSGRVRTQSTVVYFRDVVLRDELLETKEGIKIRQLLERSVSGLA